MGWLLVAGGVVGLAGGEIGGFPFVETTGVGGGETLFGQDGGGLAGASARAAVEEKFFAFGIFQHVGPFFAGAFQVAQGQQVGRGGDAGIPFGGFAHIDEDGGAGSDPRSGFRRSDTISNRFRRLGEHRTHGEEQEKPNDEQEQFGDRCHGERS